MIIAQKYDTKTYENFHLSGFKESFVMITFTVIRIQMHLTVAISIAVILSKSRSCSLYTHRNL
jgi:hypothetical protein